MRKLTFIVLPALLAINVASSSAPEWKLIAPGLEMTSFAAQRPARQGDSKITVLRIDPNSWDLEFAGISQTSEKTGLTARDWCVRRKCTAAINAGMFQQDQKTHVGYLRSGDHVNSNRITSYRSVAAFGPRRDGVARFHIFDLDGKQVTLPGILNDYNLAAQNLRLIQRPGVNKWQPGNRQYSAAVLGEDEKGRILFIFTRSPFSLYDLNQELLAGGPEAQLYVHTAETDLEMFGSYETAFLENDGNSAAWPIPNVFAIRPRSTAAH